MRGKQFPPRGPRSNHIKIDVSTDERKEAEQVAASLGCTVVEAFKTAMRHEANRLRDHKPAIERVAIPGPTKVSAEDIHEIGCSLFEQMMSEVPGVTVTRLRRS